MSGLEVKKCIKVFHLTYISKKVFLFIQEKLNIIQRNLNVSFTKTSQIFYCPYMGFKLFHI